MKQFVCLRLDHEQMQRLRKQERLITPTQGNQVLLDPRGNYLPGVDPRGSRYRIEPLVELLDRVLEDYPPKPESGDDLKLAWFFWNPEQQGLPRHFGPRFISKLDRRPVLTVFGPIPDWLDQSSILRKHLRQFIWTRGDADGPSRITIEMFEPDSRQLAAIALESTTADELSRVLDAAWLAYMKVRPLVARGYIDNEHGNWLRGVMEQAHQEELEVRKRAESGDLLPPGRK